MKQKLQFRTLKKNDYAGVTAVVMFMVGILIPAFIAASSFGFKARPVNAAFLYTVAHGTFAPGVGVGAFDIFTPSVNCGLLVNLLHSDGTPHWYVWGVAKPWDYFPQATLVNQPSLFPHVGLNAMGYATRLNLNPLCAGVPVLINVGSGCSLIHPESACKNVSF